MITRVDPHPIPQKAVGILVGTLLKPRCLFERVGGAAVVGDHPISDSSLLYVDTPAGTAVDFPPDRRLG